MINLAGVVGCDNTIVGELRTAGINIRTTEPHHSEVPYNIIGKLGELKFVRAWYYWIVDGLVPIKTALKIWERCHETVRAGGDAGCRHPYHWVVIFDERGREVIPLHIDCDGSKINQREMMIKLSISNRDDLKKI